MIEEPVRVLIVEARYYNDLSDLLLAGARRALEAVGAEYNVIQVPGALEIPTAVAIAEGPSERPRSIASASTTPGSNLWRTCPRRPVSPSASGSTGSRSTSRGWPSRPSRSVSG